MTGARLTLENPELEIDFSDHQRRWTVLLRLIRVIPHLVVLIFLSIALIVTVVIGWFTALVLGRLPRWAHQFMSDFVHWYTRVTGYLMLLTDRYGPPPALHPRLAHYCCPRLLPRRGSLSSSFSA